MLGPDNHEVDAPVEREVDQRSRSSIRRAASNNPLLVGLRPRRRVTTRRPFVFLFFVLFCFLSFSFSCVGGSGFLFFFSGGVLFVCLVFVAAGGGGGWGPFLWGLIGLVLVPGARAPKLISNQW